MRASLLLVGFKNGRVKKGSRLFGVGAVFFFLVDLKGKQQDKQTKKCNGGSLESLGTYTVCTHTRVLHIHIYIYIYLSTYI